MSWAKQNYEKIVIGVGALGLLGGIGLIVMKMGQLDELAQPAAGVAKGRKASELVAKVDITRRSLESPHEFNSVDDGGRQLFLTKSVPLFAREGVSKKLFDIMAADAQEIHQGIPNKWFLENDIEIGRANAPFADKDNDGFSNKEEYVANTNPSLINSHPALINKLGTLQVANDSYKLSFTEVGAGAIILKYIPSRGRPFTQNIKPGETAFTEGPHKERFKYIKKEQIVQKEGPLRGVGVATVTLEDKSDIPSRQMKKVPRSNPPMWNSYRVRLVLRALNQSGDDVWVAEGAKFALPFTDENKKYTVKSIKPEVDGKTFRVEVTWGDKQSKIFKGVKGAKS